MVAARVSHRGAESNDVAVGIDHDALMLSPLGVLRSPDVRASCSPSTSDLVGVFDEQIRRRRCRGYLGGDYPQMNLATIEAGEAVAAALVRAGCEAKSVVMLQGDGEVTDRKYWGDPLRANHAGNATESRPGQARDGGDKVTKSGRGAPN